MKYTINYYNLDWEQCWKRSAFSNMGNDTFEGDTNAAIAKVIELNAWLKTPDADGINAYEITADISVTEPSIYASWKSCAETPAEVREEVRRNVYVIWGEVVEAVEERFTPEGAIEIYEEALRKNG